jgi:prepilin-type N-terminal cleavage/methylation domain-containing protein
MTNAFTSGPHRRGAPRAGYTLLELLIAMVLGVVVIGISANFAAATMRSSRATDLRDNLARDARFVGSSIARDVQDAGVSIDSDERFGSVATRNDTLVTLSVPFLPNAAESYPMVVPADTTNPLPPGGTCGATCLDVDDPNVVPFQLRVGDLALLNVSTVRRVLMITGVTSIGSNRMRLTWSPVDSIFVFPSGLSGGLRLTRTGVTVQRSGHLPGAVAARGVQTFSARLEFIDGVERVGADGFDADTLNDYDRIASVKLRSRILVERTDRSINGGGTYWRDYVWRVSPRNLAYQRNRS